MFNEAEFKERIAALKEIENIFERLARKYATQPSRGRTYMIHTAIRQLIQSGPTAAELEKHHQELVAFYGDSQISEGFWGEVNFFFECGGNAESMRRFVIVTPESKIPCAGYIVWVHARTSLQSRREEIIAEVDRKSAATVLPSIVESAYNAVTSWQELDMNGSMITLR